MAAPEGAEMLVIGIAHRPHGLDGEISVAVRTSFPERFVPGLNLLWRRGERQRRLTLTGVRRHGERMLLSFEGVGDVEAARALAGGDLCVPEEDAFPAPEGFFYSHQIQGFRCEDPRGLVIGTAVGLEQTQAGPMLEIDMPGRPGVLVPFVEGIVVRIDRAGQCLVLDPPEGLLDL